MQTKQICFKERQKKSVEVRVKRYDEYNWFDLSQRGELGKLKVEELNKYLHFHKLSLKGLKADKVRRVMFHICRDIQHTEVDID